MRKKVYTVSIGIPAHNEEINIKNLLRSVLNQRGDNFKIQKIYVLCDGCTDNTAAEAKNIASIDKRVIVITDSKRKGKSQRLNRFYQLNQSDIAINFDADVTLVGNRVIQKMLRNFDKDVAMVSACNLPVKGQTLFQKITRAGDLLWFDIRSSYKKGQNIYNSSGCSTAVTKNFADSFSYPKGTIADQQYIYHCVKTAGKKFCFAKNTLVLYRSPDNHKDYFLQAHRSLTEKYPIINIVGGQSEKEYEIPVAYKTKGVVLGIIKDPIFTSLSLVLATWIRVFPPKADTLRKKGMWTPAVSTKKAIEM
jgi:glycosyltransferase involved in cell wall biosynthesis